MSEQPENESLASLTAIIESYANVIATDPRLGGETLGKMLVNVASFHTSKLTDMTTNYKVLQERAEAWSDQIETLTDLRLMLDEKDETITELSIKLSEAQSDNDQFIDNVKDLEKGLSEKNNAIDSLRQQLKTIVDGLNKPCNTPLGEQLKALLDD